jgi:hypothetical protein
LLTYRLEEVSTGVARDGLESKPSLMKTQAIDSNNRQKSLGRFFRRSKVHGLPIMNIDPGETDAILHAASYSAEAGSEP